MARYDHRDIMLELIDLCRDFKSDILQQLTYYRASVYKTETAEVIERKIGQLRVIADLLGHELLQDSFRDYDEMKRDGLKWITPGECLLSTRVLAMHQATEQIFDAMLQDLNRQGIGDPQILARNLQKHRRELLSMCRQGSRQWAFFNSL